MKGCLPKLILCQIKNELLIKIILPRGAACQHRRTAGGLGLHSGTRWLTQPETGSQMEG